MSLLTRVVARINGTAVPEGFTGTLDREEHVLASSPVSGGCVVITSLGVWIPGPRRVDWHRISKARWQDPHIEITEAVVGELIETTEILQDQPPQRLALDLPGRIPQLVQARVERSIAGRQHRDLSGGGAWFVQRRVPGQDGILLQVRPDPGTDPDAVRKLTTAILRRIEA